MKKYGPYLVGMALLVWITTIVVLIALGPEPSP